MKFFRRKDKKKNGSDGGGQGWKPGFGANANNDPRPDDHRHFGGPSGLHDPRNYPQSNRYRSMSTRNSPILLARLPAPILERIFAAVCPHSRDESYETCENSSIEDACMLCDLRDLAHCVAVCKRWRLEAAKVLYHSVRIDSVHYCDREAILAERRKRRSFFDRNGEPEDPAQSRLKLLCRTLRDDPVRRGALVQFLKMPYMLREASQADLARTIAVTPNLRYVDLPEGLFTDDPKFMTLRLEVQARCLEIRKMIYMGGSENSLQALASGRVWTKLEVLELIKIEMDANMLRYVLGALGDLHALKISQSRSVSDETLFWAEHLPPFPPVEELILTDVPNVTAEGLKGWLAVPEARQALKVLTLNQTGVKIWTLQEVVGYVPKLKHLSIMDSVSAAMPAAAGTQHIPPLSSSSLETLHFEITATSSSPKYSDATSSYYSYLAGSLLSGGLPNLSAVYVRDPNFPDLLLGLPPPAPGYAEGGIARPSSSGSFSPFSGSGFSPKSPPAFPSSPPNKPFVPGHRPQGSVGSFTGSSYGHTQRFSSNNPFASLAGGGGGLGPPGLAGFMNLPAKLEVFTKGDDDQLGWSFHKVGRGSSGTRGERPLSSYGLGQDVMGGSTAGWSSGAGARRSVLVGGAGAGGGFLAVPTGTSPGERRRLRGEGGSSFGREREREEEVVDEWPRPRSSTGEKNRDLWR
ncbi:hypothetical protein QBC35DRAFT_379730 [Podospora australis]|uniref:F-box domain-containing protein n=1 Tax=Podospora australis TaxID=1536484 RepID=A0AAN7AJN8_9PEZI|nr:hypothetical protein QBC35DRAFT_379730 [Podospora australis]